MSEENIVNDSFSKGVHCKYTLHHLGGKLYWRMELLHPTLPWCTCEDILENNSITTIKFYFHRLTPFF